MINFILSSHAQNEKQLRTKEWPKIWATLWVVQRPPDITYPIRSTHKQPQPWLQHHTCSDLQPTPARPQLLALTYSQRTPGLEEHNPRSEFMREEVTPSLVTSRGSWCPSRTPEPVTAQRPPRQDSFPVVDHPRPPLPWLLDNLGLRFIIYCFLIIIFSQ